MAKAVKKGTYDASDIDIFLGLEGVRRKPAMYLGGAGSDAITHMAKEIIGNSNDEAMNGHGSVIGIHIENKETLTVWDQGRGIPVGPHPKHKGRDTLTMILTELHAGGKMRDNAYEASSGVHGVGSSVVNALSKSFEVWSYRNKKWNYQKFSAGKEVSKVITKEPPKLSGVKPFKKQGTIIRYTPDYSCFEKGSKLEVSKLIAWLEDVSWVLPVEYQIYDGAKVKTIHKPNGMKDRFAHECKVHGVEPLGEPFVYSDKKMNVMIGWVASSDSYVTSSVSMGRTANHGTHLDGLYDALLDSFAEVATKKDDYSKDSLKKGIVVVVNVNLHGPKFSSQDKVKLVTLETRKEVYRTLYFDETTNKAGPLLTYLKKDKELARTILDRAGELTRITEEFKASADLASKVKTVVRGRVIMPDGFSGSRTKNPMERELFILEGESAGGCHFGDTEVLLEDGSKMTFERLVEDFEKGVDHRGWAFDRTNKVSVPFTFFHPRIVKEVTQYVEMELEDGTIWKGTLDHPWLLANGDYVDASKLQVGDEIQEALLPENIRKKQDS